MLEDKKCSKCNLIKPIAEFHKVNRRGRCEAVSQCILCERLAGKVWSQNNKAKQSLKNKKYRSENPEKAKKYLSDFHKNHPEIARIYAKKFRENNPEKKKFWDRRWAQNNPEKVRLNVHIRKARIKGNGGIITPQEWLDLCNFYGNKCLACGRADIKLTLDHVVPIFCGGKNMIENAQPLCKSCNSKKHTKIIDYRPTGSSG